MSYLGSIGVIMGGSGLEELWETAYAKNSVSQMVEGKPIPEKFEFTF